MADNAPELNQNQVEELVRELDSESNFRKLAGTIAKVTTLIAIALSVFQLYTSWFPLESIKQRAIHLTFVMVLAFLLYPARKGLKKVGWLDWLMVGGTLATVGYIVVMWDDLIARNGYLVPYEYLVGGAGILLVIEAARRVLGKELVIMAAVFLGYAYFGKHIPGILGHRGYSVERIIEHMFFTTEGVFGITLGVSATYMFLFILMGSFLTGTGLTKLINDGAVALAGRAAGGPAKVALVATSMMGMLNGSAVANAASTGAFTIPMMKKVGYKPEFAAAVEGSGSVGGQIMPPVMGAAAFLIAEFLRIDYGKIVLAAAIPAVLYYVSIYLMVHLEARKLGLRGLPKEELPSLWPILKARGHMLIPVVIMIYMLLSNYTPMLAGVAAIISTVICSWLSPATRLSFRGLLKALEDGARSAVGVAVATAVVGFVIGTASLTSLGLNLGNSIVKMAGDNLYLGLFLTMITAIIVGTGVPTTATYIIVATVSAPALIKMGIAPLAAHLFVFYYGAMADVTPPTALAPYTAAGIARSDPTRTTWISWKLSLSGFIVPYFFATNPELLLGTVPFTVASLIPIVGAIVGILAVSAGLQGWMWRTMTMVERLLVGFGGLLLIHPALLTSAIGLVLVGGVAAWQRFGQAKPSAAPAE
ncbi:MAG TPA: TRAP transporter permease [Symbiobacteriaceae bacterium]|nr:TRAP transporter permease [Symbiobacteriaceae bacterium]